MFDNVFKQLIRQNDDGTEESFEDPRVQAQRLQSLLRKWLVKNGLNLPPIEHLVFFKSATKTILKTNLGDRTDFNKVCKGRDLFNKIETIEQRFNHERVDTQTITQIGKFLLSQHIPKPINILKEYKLTEKDIRSGVCCPNEKCQHIPMKYKRGKWICSSCLTTSKDAHLDALSDRFHLIGPTITNFEFRSFLNLPTIHTSQKFLIRLNLPATGKNKNRIYQLNPKKVAICGLP